MKNYDVTVQYVTYYTTKTPSINGDHGLNKEDVELTN